MAGSLTRYYREFIRGTEKDLFKDKVADQDFQNKNFIDFFGKTWVPNNPKSFSMDSVVKPFFDDTNTFSKIFAAADGSVIQWTEDNSSWLRQNIRFVAVAAGSNDGKTLIQPFGSNGWTLFIVGSSQLESNNAFLQVACWNGKAFRYYERTGVNNTKQLAWIFLGDSTQAFGEKAYLGPFNGHVNGSLVMKELEKPWIHWLADSNNFTNSISPEALAKFNKYSYLSGTQNFDSAPLSSVESAQTLQNIVQSGIVKWYTARRQMDFLDDKAQPLPVVKNVRRWLAHALLTTTVNIGTSQADDSHPDQWVFAQQHFYNTELVALPSAQDIAPSDMDQLVFSESGYGEAIDKLKIALVQSGDTPDKSKHPLVYRFDTADGYAKAAYVAEYGEGQNQRFNILQPSYEDIQGVNILLANSQQKTPLMSKDCLISLLMVDPWNPVYSWRRGVLLQYVPETTKLVGTKYDLELQLEEAVRASPRFINEPDSPEQEFIKNWDARRQGKAKFSEQMTDYLQSVDKRLKDPNQSNAAMVDYLSLAESRRRIYRPLPLDEFDLTLPFATVWPADKSPAACLEMKSDGTIQNVSCRGRKFFINWIKSLSGGNPDMIPKGDKDDTCTDATFFAKESSADAIEPLNLVDISSSAFKLNCQSSYDYITRISQCPMFRPPQANVHRS